MVITLVKDLDDMLINIRPYLRGFLNASFLDESESVNCPARSSDLTDSNSLFFKESNNIGISNFITTLIYKFPQHFFYLHPGIS